MQSWRSTLAQIMQSARRLVKVLLGIQQKFYQTSIRAIFLLLDIQQIFTPSKRRLVASYFSATRHLVETFYQMSSTKSSTRRLVEQKIWANIIGGFWNEDFKLVSLLPHHLLLTTAPSTQCIAEPAHGLLVVLTHLYTLHGIPSHNMR